MCDEKGVCVDSKEDEVFRLSTTDGKLTLNRVKITIDTTSLDAPLLFEQPPSEMLATLLPLYMNSMLLRAFLEATTSELASRMNAMSSASENADALKKSLSLQYNRK